MLEEYIVGKIIAITATKDTDLDRIYELVPPDIELKRIDVDEPISIQSQQMSGVVALLHAGRPYEKFDTEESNELVCVSTNMKNPSCYQTRKWKSHLPLK